MRSSVGGAALCNDAAAVRALELDCGMAGLGREDVGRRAAIALVVCNASNQTTDTRRGHVRMDIGVRELWPHIAEQSDKIWESARNPPENQLQQAQRGGGSRLVRSYSRS